MSEWIAAGMEPTDARRERIRHSSAITRHC